MPKQVREKDIIKFVSNRNTKKILDIMMYKKMNGNGEIRNMSIMELTKIHRSNLFHIFKKLKRYGLIKPIYSDDTGVRSWEITYKGLYYYYNTLEYKDDKMSILSTAAQRENTNTAISDDNIFEILNLLSQFPESPTTFEDIIEQVQKPNSMETSQLNEYIERMVNLKLIITNYKSYKRIQSLEITPIGYLYWIYYREYLYKIQNIMVIENDMEKGINDNTE